MNQELRIKNIFKSIFLNLESRKFLIILTLILAVGCWLLAVCFSPPLGFPDNQIITIEKGETFKEVSQNFESKNLIRSSFVFEILGWILRKEKEVKAGEYFFEKPLSAIKLLKEITGDENRTEVVKITIPEGSTIKDIVKIFKNFGFEYFDIKDQSLEGYLFPDTYFAPIDISSEKMIEIMLSTFESKTTPETRKNEVVIMASLLEKEAAKQEDRKLISGILWKRLEAGMPLQVDAVFQYIIGKNSFELTLEDLKVDSPYNTYLYKGLPPGPIANPGLESLEAALNPTESNYWYYLSDKQSNLHYSATYREHLIKKEKYLK